MTNQYETVFIITPVLSETQMKEAVEKFKNLITENGGEIVHEDYWGLRKLAYPIRHKSTGYYYLIEFKSESSFLKVLEKAYRHDERVIRFLTSKLEKYAIKYNEKRRDVKLQQEVVTSEFAKS